MLAVLAVLEIAVPLFLLFTLVLSPSALVSLQLFRCSTKVFPSEATLQFVEFEMGLRWQVDVP